MKLINLVEWVYKSKGVKRTFCSVLAPLAVVAPHIPFLAPYTEMIIQAAGLFGCAGVANAVMSGGGSDK